ncbi:MAG: hypothetical protein ACE5I3_07940 [Phycisphaerae bacterium]
MILLGLGGYFGSDRASITALIPAFFGLPIGLLGGVALQAGEKVRAHTMHAAVVIALLGLLGSAGGVPGAIKLVTGGDVSRPPAVVAKAIMALFCLIFIALSVKSFIAARRKRSA